MKNTINKITPVKYHEGFLESVRMINRETYKGRGRPRKSDYMSFDEAQRKINSYYNMIIGTHKNIT